MQRSSLPLLLPHPRVLAALCALEIVLVAVLARKDGDISALHVAVACVLAPLGLLAAAAIAGRVSGPRLGVGAAVVALLLPVAARLYFYGPFLAVYDRPLRASFVGLRGTGWFALGVACAVAVAVSPRRIAAAAGVVAALAAAIAWIDTDWTTLYDNFHETTWSPTLLSLLPLAGTIGLMLRDRWLGAAVGGWFAVLVLRGVHQPYGTGGFWLSLGAAVPAAAVLLSGLGLLVPPLRLPRAARPAAGAR